MKGCRQLIGHISGICACLLLFEMPCAARASQEGVRLKFQGSTTLNPVVAEAAEWFRARRGWSITVDTQGGSSGGISALGQRLVDAAMSSRPVNDDDRATYKDVDFVEHPIGRDGVALAVSMPVWEGGVHSVSRKQVQDIYESRVRNWKDLGGSDAPIVFYNKEPGRGTWEVFANWAYNGHKNAPLVSHPEVGGNEEARNKVAFHPSAVTQLSFAWVEGSDRIRALGIRLENGKVVFPSRRSIQDGSYPLARTLFVVTNGKARGALKEFIEFLRSAQGQRIVVKHGYLAL